MRFVRKRPMLAAFLIPLFIEIIICIGNSIYPFGNNCLLHMDLYHQYCPFFSELHDKIINGGSLQYSWNLGLGSDFVSLYAYYLASPLNWLVAIFPKTHIIEFIELLILLKIAASGATFFYFLKEHFGLIGKDGKYHGDTLMVSFVFSTAYALSGFVAAYSWDVMWMDVIALAPLVIAGLDRLVREKKPGLYYVSLALAIWCNYYLCIMLCIFLVLYFFWMIINQKDRKIRAFVQFALYSLLAGGTGAMLMIPEMKILSYSGSSEMTFPKIMEWYFNIITEIGRMCTGAAVYEGTEHWPNLYAGVFCLILIVLFFLNRRISLKQKVAGGMCIALFAVSFANNYLDFIWHGFHFPDSLPGRQSYLFIFVVLMMGFETYRKKRVIKMWHIIVAAVISLILIIVSCLKSADEVTDTYAFLISILFILAYAIMMALIRIVSGKRRKLVMQFICGFAVVELAVNMALTGFGCTSRENYVQNEDDMEKILMLAKKDAKKDGDLFYRVEDTERMTKNDSMRYGYSGATQFSSLMNINVSHFYQSLYMEGGKNFYCYNGATPISSAMLSVKYFISQSPDLESPLRTLVGKCGKHYLYKNNYNLPIGFVMDENAINSLILSPSSKLNGINTLGSVLGADDVTLMHTNCDQDVALGATVITVSQSGYYYAAYDNCSSDSLTVAYKNTSMVYSKTTHRYMFDLGYFSAGDRITISNNDAEEINFTVYKLNMDAIEQQYDTLSRENFELTGFTDTNVKGNINMSKAGRLIFSIPAEEGWSMYVDGKKITYTEFAQTFISIDLDEGEHEIELKYETPGLKQGAAVTISCVGIFILITLIKRYGRTQFRHKNSVK